MLHIQYAILAINIIPLIISLKVALCWRNKSHPLIESHPFIKPLLLCVLVASTIKSFLFIVMQCDWLVNGYDATVANFATVGWACFDFFNGLFNILIIVAVNVILRWK